MPKIYFVTNRNPNRKHDPDDFGESFHPDAVDCLRFGVATVVKKNGNFAIGKIEIAPEKLREDQDKAVLGSAGIFAELQAKMCEGVDTLTFIHGYNVSFAAAIVSGARIQDAYTHPLNVVVFSWPSDGSMLPFLAYKRDRTDAAASGPALARALLKLRDFVVEVPRGEECGAKLHLMAHSMGNYVLRHGIQEARRHGSLTRLYDQIFLMAADEDDDAFEHDHKLRLLPELGQAVHVYFNRSDTALVISDRTKANTSRLGSRGPREPLNTLANLTIVDVSEVVGGFVEHNYFWEDARTVADATQILKGVAPEHIDGRRYVASQNRFVLEPA